MDSQVLASGVDDVARTVLFHAGCVPHVTALSVQLSSSECTLMPPLDGVKVPYNLRVAELIVLPTGIELVSNLTSPR